MECKKKYMESQKVYGVFHGMSQIFYGVTYRAV